MHELCFGEPNAPKCEIYNFPVISGEELFERDCSARYFNIAIGDSRLRARIAVKCLARGAASITLRAAQSIVYQNNEIGEGGVLCANTIGHLNCPNRRLF